MEAFSIYNWLIGGYEMKLRWVSIEGYRSIRKVTLDIDDFMCFIGQNNHGKSNIFYALDLFLSSSLKKVTREIFFRSPTEKIDEIIIEGRFEELSEAEMQKLRPWTVDEKLTVRKKYWIEEGGKAQVSYEALMKLPKDEWLREDFNDYKNRNVISNLPINEYLPKDGPITKQIYKDAIERYINVNKDKIEWVQERRLNPAGYKQVLDGYLPEFHLVPAIRDVTEETKTSGISLLSKLLNIIINRITKQNPGFKQLQDSISEIKKLIEGKTPEEKLIEIKEIEDRLKQELSPWEVDLSIGVEAPDIDKIFQLGTNLILDDGIPTGVSEKGHGLQRYLIFALMRVWASEAKKAQVDELEEIRERSYIFAFEEPELFLHPQMCRSTYESLKHISRTDQILICTHSPHFIDMEDYKYIVVVNKPSLEIGTQVKRIKEELFEGEKKKKFNMVRFFNPDRNELFFARKVVLVEGATERAVLPLLGKRLGCFDHRVSIIDCGSKFNLTLFMEILNAFDISYLVIHDEDPIDSEIKEGGSKYDPNKLREAKDAFNENERIRNYCNSRIGKVIQIQGSFERLIDISKSQIEKLGKPLAAVEKYADESAYISPELEMLVKEVYA
jgi:CRISPR-associated exonuclease Cas4